jgi:hypothetical protein
MAPITLSDLAQVVIAGTVVFTAWQSWRNGKRGAGIAAVVADIRDQTDGINASLVKVTGEAKYAEGVKHGEKYAERNGQ